ncbi:hypothetical protein PUN28_012158 [Cardiocondyla obscurior]|uniref:Uncharacterized protein n=1 Tax=Cardiocondyla obscurior TaxID=286306 RepID=A0AAW2FB13_9HYME
MPGLLHVRSRKQQWNLIFTAVQTLTRKSGWIVRSVMCNVNLEILFLSASYWMLRTVIYVMVSLTFDSAMNLRFNSAPVITYHQNLRSRFRVIFLNAIRGGPAATFAGIKVSSFHKSDVTVL